VETPVVTPPSSTRPAEAQAVTDASIPGEQPIQEVAFRVDLSSPETAVRSFVKAFVLGDADSVLACWLPTASDYEDIKQAISASPDDPQQRSKYAAKVVFQSFDPDVEMPIVSLKDGEGGLEVVWRVTLKKDAAMNGQTFPAGSTLDLDATLVKVGDSWFFNNM
jgi:hypothetical protein